MNGSEVFSFFHLCCQLFFLLFFLFFSSFFFPFFFSSFNFFPTKEKQNGLFCGENQKSIIINHHFDDANAGIKYIFFFLLLSFLSRSRFAWPCLSAPVRFPRSCRHPIQHPVGTFTKFFFFPNGVLSPVPWFLTGYRNLVSLVFFQFQRRLL